MTSEISDAPPDCSSSNTPTTKRPVFHVRPSRLVLPFVTMGAFGFTQRERGNGVLIRPISARYMHKKEVESYEKTYPNV
jgi:hypothetical protein